MDDVYHKDVLRHTKKDQNWIGLRLISALHVRGLLISHIYIKNL